VIATDNASLPEVVSGKVLLVPPRDVAMLAEAMQGTAERVHSSTPSRVHQRGEHRRTYTPLQFTPAIIPCQKPRHPIA
ncbi:MAG: glycosyltransferase family 4 protein, partial [Victivallales bacterium]|nr:glycosyltransferase family 4 protein [Victivallales bacterium]